MRESIRSREYLFTKHALTQTLRRRISISEIEQAMLSHSEVIEFYPDDKYGPSALIFGLTQSDRPLHVLWGHLDRTLLKIITVYEPNPEQWIDNRTRAQRYETA